MSRFSTHLIVAFTAALSVALPLHAQTDPVERDWSLTPATATAGQEFSLSVQSYRYSCANRYANQKVVVNEQRIDLSFTTSVDPLVLCPAIERPYGPSFKMPALKAGRYALYMNLLLECHVQEPMCKAAIQVEPAGTLVVSEQGKITYYLNPASVQAGTDFTLELLSPQFTCNLEYLRTSSSVQDNKITLTFLDKPNPLVRCVPEREFYGPAYKLRGLQAGTYEVWAERLPACVEEDCKVLPVPVLAGKLVVNPEPKVRKGWFLKSREAKASAPFNLQVVNHDYGNCNTSFEHASLVVRDGKIDISFVIEDHPERVCVQDLRPHGPAFAMQGMRAGRYPVTVQVLPACVYDTPSCLPVILLPAPAVVDTLVVTQTLGLGGPARPASGALASWRDGALSLRLPEGATGTWGVDVLSLSGHRLHKGQVAAGNGAALLGFRKPERGMVLIRMTSPAQEIHTLKVPVKD